MKFSIILSTLVIITFTQAALVKKLVSEEPLAHEPGYGEHHGPTISSVRTPSSSMSNSRSTLASSPSSFSHAAGAERTGVSGYIIALFVLSCV